jgi:hypothetical protein
MDLTQLETRVVGQHQLLLFLILMYPAMICEFASPGPLQRDDPVAKPLLARHQGLELG